MDLTGHPVYFYGRGSDESGSGHAWYAPGIYFVRTFSGRHVGAPWEHVDAKYAPQNDPEQTQGRAVLVHDQDWTVLAFWDRTGDSRLGSNANFVAPGTHTFEEMCALGREHFPEIWQRFDFEVRLV